MLTERSAGCVLFNENTRQYLLLNYETGHWDFPKGNIEKREKEVDTVIREVEEETGITDIEFVEGFREVIKYFYRRDGQLVSKEVVFFLAKTKTDKVTISHEHVGFAWLPLDEALIKTTYANSKDLLKKADSYISRKGY